MISNVAVNNTVCTMTATHVSHLTVSVCLPVCLSVCRVALCLQNSSDETLFPVPLCT